MPNFDELKQKVGETAGVVAGHAINIAKSAGEKISYAAKLGRLKAEMLGEREIIRRSYQQIGKLYVEHFADTPHDVMLADVEKVSLAQQRIAVIEEEIVNLKSDGAVDDEPEIFDEDDHHHHDHAHDDYHHDHEHSHEHGHDHDHHHD
ncbi:MAG: hypothetical protein LBC65_02910 [Oscillospiraceae bacterium]|jgi:hypothetical protein|nr:hypothetical protein [Oscillospiraceae bacterium]